MITVHHLEHSRSHRILWLLEELGVAYEMVRYARDPVTMLAPPGLRAIHPLGKAPVLVDGEIVVAESGAILEYLIERHDSKGAFAPATGTEAHRRYRYWMHYAEGSAMPPLLLSLVLSRIRTAPMPFFARPIARGIADKVMHGFVGPQLRTHFGFVDAELAKSSWMTGDAFSAADVQMSFPLEAALVRGDAAPWPNIARWVERIRARPAYIRAVERGGPVEIMR